MAKKSKFEKALSVAGKRAWDKQSAGEYDAAARIDEPVELYAVSAAGWKKGTYNDRDFDNVYTEIRIDSKGVVHMILKKDFGGYNGEEKFTERVLDIKFDHISVGRLQEFFNTVEDVE